jgi:hypothetical protein
MIDTQPIAEQPVVVNPDRFLANRPGSSAFGRPLVVRKPWPGTRAPMCHCCMHGQHRKCSTGKCGCACLGEFRVAHLNELFPYT